jgi:hypothetical protein
MKTNYLFLAAAAALSFTACCNHDDISDIDLSASAPVQATVIGEVAGNTTRADWTAWSESDKIGVSVVEESTNYNAINKEFDIKSTSDGSFEAANGHEIYFKDASDVTFAAYYPYTSEGITNNAITIKTLDTSNAYARPTDYLFASGAVASSADPEIKFIDNSSASGSDLRFTHKLCQLTLAITKGGDLASDSNTPSVTVSGFKHEGTLNIVSGDISASTTADAVEFTIPMVDNTEYNYNAMLIPQTPSAVDVAISLGEDTYKVSLPSSNLTFASSTIYQFNITLTKGQAKVTKSNVVGWTDADAVDAGSTSIQAKE